MDTRLNKSDYLLIGIYLLLIPILLHSYEYYLQGASLRAYLIDFSAGFILIFIFIFLFMYWLIPVYIIKKKRYIHFTFFSLFFMTIIGITGLIAGFWSIEKSWDWNALMVAYRSIPNLITKGLLVSIENVGLPLGLLLTKKFYESQTKLLDIQKQQKESELKFLRSQMEPHFLFNNLNSVVALIDSNTEIAKEYVNRLSLIYRYLIKTKDSEIMELHKEMRLAENYIFLIETRFGKDYNFKITQNTTLSDKFIPTGAMQTLLENVIKHNKPRQQNNIKVTIAINEDLIIVSNTKSDFKTSEESFGTGLVNLNARYKLLSDKEITIINTELEYKISIPIIKLRSES
ncbi:MULTISPECIES: sensor histidine kinase [Aquimarina]|uniref:sensor histidine kinase n=1 Tax=Aquimarina TaxID=290174 RepID=UPI000944B56A|nr:MULTISPECIES: histidine kinase [Aquimarina]